MHEISVSLSPTQLRTMVRRAMDEMTDEEYVKMLNMVISEGKYRSKHIDMDKTLKLVRRVFGPDKNEGRKTAYTWMVNE